MAKFFTTWTVLPHSPIEKLTENLWSVEGKMPDGKTTRRMIVIRLTDGRLIVHNGIALDEPEMKELDQFGTVSAIVVPSGFHRQDALIWHQRYPKAKVYAPEGSIKRIQLAVPVDGNLKSVPGDLTVRTNHLDGIGELEGVIEVKSADGATLIFNDAIMNMPKLSGIQALLLQPTGRPGVPRIMRLLAIKNRRVFHDHLRMLATTPDLKRIVPGHGKIMDADAPGALNTIAHELED